MIDRGVGSKVFDYINHIFLGIVAIFTIYPFWDVLVVSISPLEDYLATKIHIFPTRIDFKAYVFMFRMKELWTSYGVTIFVTVVGTAINMMFTVMTGYVLSKDYIKGQRFFMFAIVFTMLFSGGLIPVYIIVRKIGIMNTLWAMILPQAIFAYNLIIMRNFFYTIPSSLEESARIDGCTDVGILFKIVIPLSMPAIATLSLFYAVAHWNDFFSAVLYINDKPKWPLQLFLRAMLFENEASTQSGGDDPYLFGAPIKMATIMVAVIPIICVYPFFQRYFVKGVLIGAVKG